MFNGRSANGHTEEKQMSEQATGVAPGTLSGINLSGEEPDATLPPEDERTLAESPEGITTPSDEPPAPAPEPEPEPEEPQDPHEPVEEPQGEPEAAVDAPAPPETETASGGGGEPPQPPAAPPATSEPEAARQQGKKGAPARPYVVLKQDTFDDGSVYFTQPHQDGTPLEIEARNAQNAMRQAFKALAGDNAEAADATLIVIPKSMFRPTQVRLQRTERVSVQFG
jgi:hypothetical protein